MKNIFFPVVFTLFLLTACAKKQDPFLIGKGNIGKLSKEITVAKLDSVFANDSLVKRIGEGDYVQAGTDSYLVYEKGGKHLLTVTPAQQHDTTETIETVRVIDPRFRSAKGLGTTSTFKDIKDNYKISDIQNAINSIVVFVNEIDAFITIDKKELPANLRYDSSIKIEAVQIPDEAKIKYFMLGW